MAVPVAVPVNGCQFALKRLTGNEEVGGTMNAHWNEEVGTETPQFE